MKSALVMAMLAAAAGLASPATAEVLSISGVAFQQQCPCAANGGVPDVNNGVLVPTDVATFYANVDFPVNGQRICSFSLIYQDTNANDTLSARLLRKSFSVGSNVFNSPALLAEANSAAGVVNTVRVTKTLLPGKPVINDRNGFYFVEVSAPTINFALLGVQVDYRPVCP